jgi:predicted anti-sigma-YlaC factor YlaD
MMMTCQQVAKSVTDFLEGSLSWKDSIRYRIHLWLCLGCRNFLRQMKYTVKTLQQFPRNPIPLKKREALLRQFHESRKGPNREP